MATVHPVTSQSTPSGNGYTERVLGRALAVLWIFIVGSFTLGSMGGVWALLGTAVIPAAVGLCVWRWDPVAAWVLGALALTEPIIYTITYQFGGDPEKFWPFLFITFGMFGLPGLIAAVLMLDGARRMRKG